DEGQVGHRARSRRARLRRAGRRLTLPDDETRSALGPTMICCIDVPTLPLQLLLREKPEWKQHPAVVVAEDAPTAEILHASVTAMKRGVARGMRLAAARAVTRELRAGVVEESAMRAEADAIFRRLYDFSPRIEPDVRVAGRFYADPSGLGTLFGTPATW